MVRGPEQEQVRLLSYRMAFHELTKQELQVTLESNLLG